MHVYLYSGDAQTFLGRAENDSWQKKCEFFFIFFRKKILGQFICGCQKQCITYIGQGGWGARVYKTRQATVRPLICSWSIFYLFLIKHIWNSYQFQRRHLWHWHIRFFFIISRGLQLQITQIWLPAVVSLCQNVSIC